VGTQWTQTIDPNTINPQEWADKHFGAGHSADALARKVTRLASDWLEGVLAGLTAEGIGPDRAEVRYGPGVQIQVTVDGLPRKCWSVAIAP
jgi:hypothetical protein